LKGNEKRYLFKKAMTGLVPEKILYKKKHGFGVPISHWLRSSEIFHRRFKEVVCDQGGIVRTVFAPSYIEQLLKEHRAGSKDSGLFLWGLYCLNLWAYAANKWGK
jgi:asparagine synthase (glutamine-hydrolysing)